MKRFAKSLVLFLGLILTSGSMLAQMAITTEEWDESQTSFTSVQNSYIVRAIDVDAVIEDQISEVTVTQTIYNPGERDMEVELFFPLPNAGVVQNLVMMIDGEEIPGELLPKDEATRIYQGIVQRKRDPALMEYIGYGLFKTSVFPMAIGEERKITVRYTQVLKRKLNLINFRYPFGTQKFSAKALRSVTLNARILSSEAIKSIYSPSDEIEVKRYDDFKAEVKMEKSYVIPDRDFKMAFSVGDEDVGATVLSYKENKSDQGYFMLLASPSMAACNSTQINKDIVFVIDRSGSMAGKKIEQARKALEFVMGNLNKGDRFNIVAYDDRIETFKSDLQPWNEKMQKEATDYVFTINAGGGTNIAGSLERSLEMFEDDKRPDYVLFLTDGLATAGTIDESDIIELVKTSNANDARVFSFGVGTDVNARLLDRLSMDNGGTVEYVNPNEDIETAVASLYSNISSPVMTDIEIEIAGAGIRETFPQKLPDMFKDGQLQWTGKYMNPGRYTVKVSGRVGGAIHIHEFDIELHDHSDGSTHEYVEKIWASKRVGDLITQIDQNGRNQEMVDELIRLSKKYGILTPYTAFLAREDVEILANNEGLRRESERRLDRLNTTSGASANTHRAMKNKALESDKDWDMAMAEEAEVASTESTVTRGGTYAYDIAEDGSVVAEKVETVKKVGNKTFYWRNNQWVDGSIDEKDAKSAVKINRFSDDYFKLSKGQTAEFNRYMTFSEDVLVQMNGRVYNIVE